MKPSRLPIVSTGLAVALYELATHCAYIIEPAEDSPLLQVDDVELEIELRRRFIGGPWEPHHAISILNGAINQMTANRNNSRSIIFKHEAQAILTLLTAEDNPRVELIDDSSDDIGYTEEPVGVGTGHGPSISTSKKI